ncbi:MAG: hypothetical protein QG611_392 [Bacteroidota bacterium]|nr:hypothetical protein [Bacteroidota bacterium]
MKRNNKTLVLSLLIFNYLNMQAQIDFTQYVKKIYEGKESTALSIYDTNPESPDGNFLSFVRYDKITEGGHFGPVVKADLMIKNKSTGENRQIYKVWCNNHNGSNAIWVNDSLIAFQVTHLKDFVIYNVMSNKVLYGPVNGELGHKSFGNILFYSVCNSRLRVLDKSREPYPARKEGLYSINCINGERKKIVKKSEIINAFIKQNPQIIENEVAILHVEPNPDNSRILFDFRYVKDIKDGTEELQGLVRADGSSITWVKERPMHVVWFDISDMFGVDTKDTEKKIYRYDLNGNQIEMLGGTSTHVGGSPDRYWYIGESGYYEPEKDGFTRVYLYKRGEKEPFALLSEWDNSKITWKWVAHVNPSFSKDGKRAYFIRALNDKDKFEAVYIDLWELIY